MLFFRVPMEKKDFYIAPTTTVVEFRQEGIICGSGDPVFYMYFGDEEDMESGELI